MSRKSWMGRRSKHTNLTPLDPRSVQPGTLRYLNEFFAMKAARDMMALKLFPNLKEVTESFGAYAAVRDLRGFPLGDPSVTVVVVGDGTTPRTAATFAFRSAWTCYGIDPRMSWVSVPSMERCYAVRSRIEDWHLTCEGPAIIVAVHSHADLPASVAAVEAPLKVVVAIPCCVDLSLDREPDIEFEDKGIWSPKNVVKIWEGAAASCDPHD